MLEKPIYKAASIKMTNSGAIGGIPPGTPLGTSGEVQNIDFSKVLGMALPGVEYVPTSLESVFKVSRGPQRSYIKQNIEKY